MFCASNMYHGIIIDQQFNDPAFPQTLTVFAKKQEGSWGIYGIEIEDGDLEKTITNIQGEMKSDQPWYAHLYNDEKLIVIFKDRVFTVTPDSSTWKEIKDYGRKLNIPEKQLDFYPNRFQDEDSYFV